MYSKRISFDYQILHLTAKFYADYPNPPYKEILKKESRPYTCLLIKNEYIGTSDAIIDQAEYRETRDNIEYIKNSGVKRFTNKLRLACYTKCSRSCLTEEYEIFLIFRWIARNFGARMPRKARIEPGWRIEGVFVHLQNHTGIFRKSI